MSTKTVSGSGSAPLTAAAGASSTNSVGVKKPRERLPRSKALANKLRTATDQAYKHLVSWRMSPEQRDRLAIMFDVVEKIAASVESAS